MSIWVNHPFCDCGDCAICCDNWDFQEQQHYKEQEQAAYDQMYKDSMANAEREHYKELARDEGKADLLDIIKTGKNAHDVIMRRKTGGMARVYFLAYCEGMHAERQIQNGIAEMKGI